MTLSTAVPNLLTDPGYLLIAPLGSTMPTNTVVGSVFTDAWDAAWLSLGATEDGSQLDYETTVEPISVAEFLDPIKYASTGRAGSLAFNMADWTLSNYNRALNGGAAALAPTSGTGATALYTVEPPDLGSEVRVMVGWESLDHTVRLVLRQALQGGTISSAFKKVPEKSLIPATFHMEVPTGQKPFVLYGAGATRA